MTLPIPGIPIDNKLLAALPRGQMDQLAPLASTRQLAQGVVLLEAGAEFDQIYFPHSGMLSLVMVLDDGNAIEVGTVGREGVVGAMAGLGLYKSSVRVVVQLPAAVTQIGAAPFRKAVEGSVAMRDLCLDYNEVLLLQARVTAACNAVHPLEARFCRWLLHSADRAESDIVRLTQEFLAEMLGVQRTSVHDVASRIQEDGIIIYSRGIIKIVDRDALLGRCCSCYQLLKAH